MIFRSLGWFLPGPLRRMAARSASETTIATLNELRAALVY
jgi:hypothetical protein